MKLTSEQESRLEELVAEMTLEEKAAQMGGVGGRQLLDDDDELSRDRMQRELKYGIGQIARITGQKEIAPAKRARLVNEIQHFLLEETRLGVPAIVHDECIAGLMMLGATIFPQPIGLASTWDPEMARRMTDIIRRQGQAVGVRQCLSPVLDVAWDPRWGRIEETLGEDPYLASRMAAAFVQGLRGSDLQTGIIAAPKHFAGGGFSEGGRHPASVHVGPHELREIFLFPFEVAIKEGQAGAVMSGMHDIDGIPCSASEELLTKILRDEWGFTGVVVGDYGAIDQLHTVHCTAASKTEAAEQALKAGVDVEPNCWDYYREPLLEAVRDGRIPEAHVDRAVRRHLRAKFALGLFDDPFADEASAAKVFDMPQHREFAGELARRSIVLLKNSDGLLPLPRDIESLAVIGPNAHETRNVLGYYSYRDRAGSAGIRIVTILEGIRGKTSPQTEVSYAQGCAVGPPALRVPRWPMEMSDSTEGFAEAVALARAADVVVAVVGGSSGLTTSENRDRTEITLPSVQEELLKVLYETGTPLVVVLVNGRPLYSPWMFENVSAIVEAWLPGEEAGNAVADVLFGDYNPGGKLPVSILASAGQAPMPYNRRPFSLRTYVYHPAYPALPFGHGLSYTEFEYSGLQITPQQVGEQTEVAISCTVENTGGRAGDEVVQLYLHDAVASVVRPIKELKGFARITLEPGEKKTVTFTLPMGLLAFYDRDMRLVVEAGEFAVMVGSSSEDIRLEGSFEVTEQKLVDPNSRRFGTEVAVE